MMIFDGFPSMERALAFARIVPSHFGLTARVFEDQESSDASDPIPVTLNPPIVQVERSDPETEASVAALAVEFDGVFAGT